MADDSSRSLSTARPPSCGARPGAYGQVVPSGGPRRTSSHRAGTGLSLTTGARGGPMTGRHLEVERKLDVDGAFVLPDLTGVEGVAAVDPPVEQSLEAVYHDTDDLRLARARVTLRRRTGGSDAGWHLKLPAAAGARQEVHEPLGRAVKNPPRALRDLVLGITRGAPTGPVTTLRTTRVATVLRDADGRALAEIA